VHGAELQRRRRLELKRELVGTPVLLVSTATQYIGTARIPAALAKAGFEVSLLTPRGTLAAQSRYVAHCRYIADDSTPAQWLAQFTELVEGTSPRLAIPCDDNSFRLLQSLVTAPPATLPPPLQRRLSMLAMTSLGNPAHYETSINKVLLTRAADAFGIRVPPYAIVMRLAEAEAFAAGHGYPVVLKLGYGVAGQWVRVAETRAQLAARFDDLLAAPLASFGQAGARRLLVQRQIEGNSVLQSIVVWNGKVLAGYAREKLISDPPPKGPSTVSRTFHCPEARAFAERLAREFGMNLFFGVEFIADRRNGELYLLEINRRITPGTPVGSLVDVDLCVALHDAMHDRPSRVRGDVDAGEEYVIAHFPQEWLRDPESRWLREHRSDCPWDDPPLFDAMVALRHA
jgi:predicted ATP-grasp superfamily ATP-dependent carboligase